GNFQKRKADGCISVEMECAALQAMCDFRGLELFMFFTSGDLLDAPEWDKRHEDGEIGGTQHDALHFKIALELAEFVCGIDLGNSGADKILTLNDWWDGPLLGLCTFNGGYCVYERIFSEEQDDWSDDYHLTPIDENAAREILQDWRRWCGFINGGGNAGDWKSGCDICEIAKLSQQYRQFKKRAEFKGVPQHYAKEIKYYFVDWD
ncbi:MAG: hypothetical protein K2J80_02190, partial [Oscillospiraceae bacterium]|nr:hypothetical protein [Oscillospiraceae bacterium]